MEHRASALKHCITSKISSTILLYLELSPPTRRHLLPSKTQEEEEEEERQLRVILRVLWIQSRRGSCQDLLCHPDGS